MKAGKSPAASGRTPFRRATLDYFTAPSSGGVNSCFMERPLDTTKEGVGTRTVLDHNPSTIVYYV